MSIELVMGTPGSGKTLWTVQTKVIPALKKNRRILTNITGLSVHRISAIFDLSPQEVFDCLKVIEGDDVYRFWEFARDNDMIIIDEIQNWFSARDWNTTNSKKMMEYITIHRKNGHELIFITQHVENIDNAIRRICDLTYSHRSHSIYGGSKKVVRCNVYDQAKIDSTPLSSRTWSHDEQIYPCYESYNIQNAVDHKKGVNIFLNPKLIALVVLLAITYSCTASGLLKAKKRSEKKESARIEQSVPQKSISDNRDSISEESSLQVFLDGVRYNE